MDWYDVPLGSEGWRSWHPSFKDDKFGVSDTIKQESGPTALAVIL